MALVRQKFGGLFTRLLSLRSAVQGIFLLLSLHTAWVSSNNDWKEFPMSTDNDEPDRQFLFPHHVPRLKKQLTTPTRVAVPLDPQDSQPGPSYLLPTPAGCGTEDYCEDDSQYPDSELVKQIVKNSTDDAQAALLFFRPAVPIQVTNKAAVPLDRLRPGAADVITTNNTSADIQDTRARFGTQDEQIYEFVQEVPVCDSLESYIYPRSARNINSQWRFVINLPSGEDNENDNYVQAVKVEKCLNAGKPCNIYSATGSSTVCRQKYSYKQLLALSDTGEQYVDSFRFPSCCVCYEQKTLSYGDLELLREGTRTAQVVGGDPDQEQDPQQEQDTTTDTPSEEQRRRMDGFGWRMESSATTRRKARRNSRGRKQLSRRHRHYYTNVGSEDQGRIMFPTT